MRLFYIIETSLLLLVCMPGIVAAQEPKIPDFSHVTITIKAEGGPCGCIECCPAYTVTIDENGTVVYNGLSGVKERGERIHSISIGAVRDLVAEFVRIDFYSLQDRYTEKKLPDGTTQIIDHSNAITISIDIDGKRKSVYIFFGAPDELMDLQRKLYDVSQIAKYTGRA